MNVRVTRTIDGFRTVLQIAGRLDSVGVSLLEEESRSVAGALVLDLSQLVSADEAGIEMLRQLVARGAELKGALPYVQMLVDAKR
jgi:anti-anti-sigma regulatory factor